jgi:hypothetical protein
MRCPLLLTATRRCGSSGGCFGLGLAPCSRPPRRRISHQVQDARVRGRTVSLARASSSIMTSRVQTFPVFGYGSAVSGSSMRSRCGPRSGSCDRQPARRGASGCSEACDVALACLHGSPTEGVNRIPTLPNVSWGGQSILGSSGFAAAPNMFVCRSTRALRRRLHFAFQPIGPA